MDAKALKQEFRIKASKDPDKYYATETLKKYGFSRKKCSCGKYFWSINSKTCGEPECSGGFRFIGNTPAKNRMSYTEVWQEFSKLFKNQGYTPIKRYPVAARWRSDTDFVQASIYDFQPYVVSGEIEPPANPLVVPQFCLRFNDIDNVGITGAHNTGFSMIGQHAFVQKKDWDVNLYFEHIYNWITKGLGLPKEEVIFHEDGWAGGGNVGPCMEFFSRGVELGNQVYMQYEQTSNGLKQLNLNVLDMGMGQERNAWFSQGAETQYDATFPETLNFVLEKTGYKKPSALLKKFIPYAALLNRDEVADIDKVWKKISKKIGVNEKELKNQIMPLSAIYSIAEHSRSLLVALSDGVLPSNVKGGYNLRVLFRRALNFIDSYGWKVDISEVCEKHSKELKSLYPELLESLENVKTILDFEKNKFAETKKRNQQIITGLISKGKKIDEKKLVELYDSQGITPEEIRQEAEKNNQTIEIPDNFYSIVSSLHEKKEQQTQTKKKEDLKIDSPPTEILYYEHYDYVAFEAKIQEIFGNKIVLDRTAFYPTSGGQLHDLGKIGSSKVLEIYKHGPHIVHVVGSHSFKKGQKVDCRIDIERRTQLAQHHTATHILNGVCRKLLGKHIFQAGAAKTLEKARLDITHYDSLTREQEIDIQKESNKIVHQNLPVYKTIMPRGLAEQKYSFSIYQGGAVPGKELRIVEIPGLDVEACGGTHLDITGDVGEIRIIKTSKIQDGIVRIEFTAGRATDKLITFQGTAIAQAKKILECGKDEIPGRAEELFEKWKLIVKKKKLNTDPMLVSTEKYRGDVIEKTAEILKTQPEHIVKTLERFRKEIEEKVKQKHH